jgi:hypothetical protein
VVVVIINFDFTFNIVTILIGILAWSVFGYLTYRIYQKQMGKPKVWKILIVLFIGLFSFSFNWSMFDTMIKIPILPLGVWVLYFAFKGKGERWQTYRSFAWLGFLANFIFLLSTLAVIPVHHAIYHENELSTYITTVENASIIPIHPSAKDFTLNKEKLLEQLHKMKQETIYSNQWYEETFMNAESNNKMERFPFQLIGTSPKWGSGFQTIIYLEEDGKGILLSTQNKQLYFRSENSLIKEGE